MHNVFAAAAMVMLIGSGGINPPRMRVSPYFGNILGMSYTSIDELGQHDYDAGSGENNDLLYTARAGYIDLGHLRESADRARYIYEISLERILNGETDYSFEVIESALYHVHLEYPSHWASLDEAGRERAACEAAIDIGHYAAHLSTIWHEIISWYGYSSTGFISEKPSAFSWEDGYSDLFGTNIAAEVLKSDMPYNEGMTEVIRREIEKLEPLPAETAREATKAIRGKWFSGRYPLLKMKKRNFDVGLDDGEITPFRVPGIGPAAPEARCPAPRMEALKRNGFVMRLTMTPREMERRQVLEIIYPNGEGSELDPAVHFPIIIDHIRQEAIRESGPDIEKPTL